VRGALLQEDVDDDMRHRVGPTPDLFDFDIRESRGFFAKDLATARDRDRLGIDVVLVIHTRSTSDPHKRRTVFGSARQRAGGQASALDVRADVGDGPTSITGALAASGVVPRRSPMVTVWGRNLNGVGTMGRERRSAVPCAPRRESM
jgi:hypothetical protein